MSEVLSMSSGPQGSASNSEAFEGPSSPELGGSEQSAAGQPSAEASAGSNEEVPRGTNGEQPNGDGRPKSAAQQKQESRYERTKREKAAFRQQQEAFRQQQAQFAQERAAFEESKKPKRNYTLGELRKFRNDWAREAEEGVIPGREELVTRADAEIAAMEAEEQASKMVVELPKRGTPGHQQQWQAAEAELARSDPEFMREGTKLDSKLREIFLAPMPMLTVITHKEFMPLMTGLKGRFWRKT